MAVQQPLVNDAEPGQSGPLQALVSKQLAEQLYGPAVELELVPDDAMREQRIARLRADG